MNQIFPQVWIALDKEVRDHLAKIFSIERTGVTEIVDQRVVSDGYTATDLLAITLEKMNEYIGSTESFARAWEVTLAKVHSELHPPLGVIESVDGEMVVAPMPEPVEPAPSPEPEAEELPVVEEPTNESKKTKSK